MNKKVRWNGGKNKTTHGYSSLVMQHSDFTFLPLPSPQEPFPSPRLGFGSLTQVQGHGVCLQSAEKTCAQYPNFQAISQILIAQQLVWLRKWILNLSVSSRNVLQVNSVVKGVWIFLTGNVPLFRIGFQMTLEWLKSSHKGGLTFKIMMLWLFSGSCL